MACRSGDVGVARKALDMGASIEALDQWGLSPMHNAALNRHEKVLEFLIERRAAVDAPCARSSQTALHLAAADGSAAGTVRLLLAAGANPLLRTAHGGTAIELAQGPCESLIREDLSGRLALARAEVEAQQARLAAAEEFCGALQGVLGAPAPAAAAAPGAEDAPPPPSPPEVLASTASGAKAEDGAGRYWPIVERLVRQAHANMCEGARHVALRPLGPPADAPARDGPPLAEGDILPVLDPDDERLCAGFNLIQRAAADQQDRDARRADPMEAPSATEQAIDASMTLGTMERTGRGQSEWEQLVGSLQRGPGKEPQWDWSKVEVRPGRALPQELLDGCEAAGLGKWPSGEDDDEASDEDAFLGGAVQTEPGVFAVLPGAEQEPPTPKTPAAAEVTGSRMTLGVGDGEDTPHLLPRKSMSRQTLSSKKSASAPVVYVPPVVFHHGDVVGPLGGVMRRRARYEELFYPERRLMLHDPLVYCLETRALSSDLRLEPLVLDLQAGPAQNRLQHLADFRDDPLGLAALLHPGGPGKKLLSLPTHAAAAGAGQREGAPARSSIERPRSRAGTPPQDNPQSPRSGPGGLVQPADAAGGDGEGEQGANIELVEVLVHRWPYVFAVASRDICAGEELTVDHGEGYWATQRAAIARASEAGRISHDLVTGVETSNEFEDDPAEKRRSIRRVGEESPDEAPAL